MVSIRLILGLVVLGIVSAEQSVTSTRLERISAKFGGLYDMAMKMGHKLWTLGQIYVYEGQDHPAWKQWHKDSDKGLDYSHRGENKFKGKIQKMFEVAHACHRNCGEDGKCHSNCPKPLAKFAAACKVLPAIEACHAKCRGDADCAACPKFEEKWMNEKYEWMSTKRPDRIAQIAKRKCPLIQKAYACHQECKPGDHECHHKCPTVFPGRHGGPWHRGGHSMHWKHHRQNKFGHMEHKFHEKMEKAHACHENCGEDVACHAKCPKPWEPIVKACEEFPKIKACHDACKDADCKAKCPKFEKAWMNRKFEKFPERAAKMAEKKCSKIEKIHACHKACKPGDHECHHACPSMHGDEDWHHREEHWKKMKEEMKEAKMCHWKCGTDASCHSKCPKPMEPFIKACQAFPKIKACHDACTDADCKEKCPKFEEERFNKKYAEQPERVTKMAEKRCPMLEKAHACHQACKPGDFECHHKCPRFHGHHGWHHKHHQHAEEEEEEEANAQEGSVFV